MKLEIGVYVRTKSFKGFPSKIGKITKIEYNAGIDNETYIALDNDEEKCRRWTEDWLIGKPSFNTVDLIEVGDYLNGFKVSKIERYDTNTIIKIGNSTFNVLEGEKIYTPSYDNNNGYEKIEKLKSIVTKEQMEIMSYKVEG